MNPGHAVNPMMQVKNRAWHALRNGRSALRALSRATLQGQYVPVAILTYHRVTDLQSDPFGLAVPPHRFREQMAFLKGNFTVLRLEDDWRTVREPSVVVTFDDGYADNYREALPILEEFGIPATFFISTGHIDTDREFWWDELERLIVWSPNAPRSFSLRDRAPGGTWATDSLESRWTLFRHLHRLLKRSLPNERTALLEQIKAWSGALDGCRPSHRPLALDELKALASSPLATIGGHTVTHPSLGRLDKELQRQEIMDCLEALREWIGRPIEVFSYPFGGPKDYGPETIEILRGAGIRKSAVCMSGLQFSWTDPYRLPRQMVSDWDIRSLAGRLSDYVQVPAAA